MQALQSKDFAKYLQTAAALRTDKIKPVALGRDQRLINPDTGAEMVPAMAPDAGEKDAFIRLMRQRGIQEGSPEWNRRLDDYINKQATHAPAASMHNYGSPVAGIDASTGLPTFVVTDKGGNVKPLTGVRPPRSAAEERAAAEAEKTARISGQMFSVMTEARKLLKTDPTGSGIGEVVDAAGRAVGYTSKGAQTAAKLESLSGWLVANVPRMEGPQSNFDVENYKTMAAKVGNRGVPVAERLAALEAVESIQRKYADMNRASAQQPASGAVRKFNPVTGKIE
jgi:hypothetical protein